MAMQVRGAIVAPIVGVRPIAEACSGEKVDWGCPEGKSGYGDGLLTFARASLRTERTQAMSKPYMLGPEIWDLRGISIQLRNALMDRTVWRSAMLGIVSESFGCSSEAQRQLQNDVVAHRFAETTAMSAVWVR